jgi:hypothetical protein
MPNELTVFGVSVVIAEFVALIAILVCLKTKRRIPKSTIELLKWLILVLVGLYLTAKFGLGAWSVIFR